MVDRTLLTVLAARDKCLESRRQLYVFFSGRHARSNPPRVYRFPGRRARQLSQDFAAQPSVDDLKQLALGAEASNESLLLSLKGRTVVLGHATRRHPVRCTHTTMVPTAERQRGHVPARMFAVAIIDDVMRFSG